MTITYKNLGMKQCTPKDANIASEQAAVAILVLRNLKSYSK